MTSDANNSKYVFTEPPGSQLITAFLLTESISWFDLKQYRESRDNSEYTFCGLRKFGAFVPGDKPLNVTAPLSMVVCLIEMDIYRCSYISDNVWPIDYHNFSKLEVRFMSSFQYADILANSRVVVDCSFDMYYPRLRKDLEHVRAAAYSSVTLRLKALWRFVKLGGTVDAVRINGYLGEHAWYYLLRIVEISGFSAIYPVHFSNRFDIWLKFGGKQPLFKALDALLLQYNHGKGLNALRSMTESFSVLRDRFKVRGSVVSSGNTLEITYFGVLPNVRSSK